MPALRQPCIAGPDAHRYPPDLRLFIAFPVPSDVADVCAQLATRLPDEAVKRVRPELLHLTAAFLGEVADRSVASAADAVAEAGRASRQFVARLGEIGAFPTERRPRAIWVGLAQGGPEHESAARRVRQALSARDLPFDDSAPLAHITIARVRERVSASERKAVADALSILRSAVPALDFRVSELHLVRSTLSPKGPTYESLTRVTLPD